ncbi:MAG: class I SAM-dependent methyltransferase, partial [Spirochaetota bacterium]
LFNKSAVSALDGVISKVRHNEHNVLKTNNELTIILDEQKKQARTLDDLHSKIKDMDKKLTSINREIFGEEPKAEDHLPDAMYAAFEDQFRGRREDIKERQRIYLAYIKEVNAGTKEAPVLDLGCGRGEWLELLKENEFVAEGVDSNSVFIKMCSELGLDATESDIIEYFRSQKEKTYGAITGFHIVEHLPLTDLINLFDEALRTLIPGGVVIFETPNPENIIMGSFYFYRDPSHLKPIVPDTLKFLLEQRGFVKSIIKRLHPRTEAEYTGNKYIDDIIHSMNMEMDYSVIGYKP